MNLLCIVSPLLFCAVSVQAHPGHGPGELSLIHASTHADHLGVLLVAAVILFCALRTFSWVPRKSISNK